MLTPALARAIGFALLLLPGCASGPPRVSPDRYRAMILTIDSVMVRDAEFRSDPEWAGTALRALGRDLLKETSVDSTRREEFNTRLWDLASRTDGIGSDIRLTEAELEKEWVEARGTIFKDASWFHRASTDDMATETGEGEQPQRSAPQENSLPGDPREDPGLVALSEVVYSLSMVAGKAGDELLREQRGSVNYQRTVASLEGEVVRLERLLASAPNTFADSNFSLAQREAGVALGHVRKYIAAGGDTVTGSPGREALEQVAYYAVEAQTAMGRIEPW